MASVIRSALRYLEVKHDGEQEIPDGLQSKWGNFDIFPVPVEQRRFNIWSYFSFWAIASMSVTAWAFGGNLLALGLSVGEGICCIVVAWTFVGLFAYLCGHPGSNMNLGFTALARTTFGLYGSYLPVMLLVFENVIFFGVNAYFGGLSAVVVISAMSSSFRVLKNTLPESAGITTQALPAACGVAIVFFGLFGWAINDNNGSVGKSLTSDLALSPTALAFGMLYGISTSAGSATAYSSRMSDWTRFSRTKNAPTVPLLLGAPILGSVTSILGILATNAVHNKNHVVEWNPLQLLLWLQKDKYSPACRAGTFFAGLALFYSLIINNLMGKIVPAGMDCAGLFPRWITTRRGSIILCIIGIIIQPWRFVTESTTFLKVLSSFGGMYSPSNDLFSQNLTATVFVSPLTAILAADYWLVHRRKWNVPDIFKQDGIYWYTFGVNWRAIIAFTLSIVWSMPGFVSNVKSSHITTGWTRMYQMSYIVNIAIAVVVFCVLSLAFPQVGLRTAAAWGEAPTTSVNSINDLEAMADKDGEPVEVEYA
ncbi:uncharacterized protein LY89DRAFT_763906 [Mollisia scopiformis]|uniref:Allantoin permease n=1 Tax=Mollisia scopiformis TaxID=149040 RepID=A0A132B9W2_MOLSC|nr:uncharacterized protein LY89DRAFT_763906 [Mollisia scopiformis]KUJ09188.1 hypothetical protein LY89DRAFT_763906 [Mollisia scopiformis]